MLHTDVPKGYCESHTGHLKKPCGCGNDAVNLGEPLMTNSCEVPVDEAGAVKFVVMSACGTAESDHVIADDTVTSALMLPLLKDVPEHVEKLAGTSTKLLDTRKTTPGMRLLDKEAVRIGGGCNHRIGLFDMILIKDNHIDFAGGIEKAIDAVHNYLQKYGKQLKIEIEARSMNDVERILRHNQIHRIMFDNFDVETTRKAVELVNNRYETETSGNINLNNIRDYALCGVDYISVGALTHQIKSIDMSLKADRS